LKLGTYTIATKKFPKADNIHPDLAYDSQPENSSQHSFNWMALSLKSVKCQYFVDFCWSEKLSDSVV